MYKATNNTTRKKNKAFTLIELLVVIAIISLLVSILLPSLKKAQDLAKAVVCLSREKAMGTAYQMYASEQDGVVVPALLAGDRPWYCFFAPYLGIGETTESSVYWDHVVPQKKLAWTCDVLHKGGVSYVMPDSLSYNGNWFWEDRTLSDFADPGSTICLLDGFASAVNKGLHWWWPPANELRPSAAHEGKTNILFVDGHAESDSGDLSDKYTILSREPNDFYWTVEE